MFSNLNGYGPSFVSKRSRQWPEIGLGRPFKAAAGNMSSQFGEIKTLSSLLQAALEQKLDHVKCVYWRGRSLRLNAETQAWKLAIWLVEAAGLFLSSEKRSSLKSPPTHHTPSTRFQGRKAQSKIPLSLYSWRGHRCKKAIKGGPNPALTVWQRGRKCLLQRPELRTIHFSSLWTYHQLTLSWREQPVFIPTTPERAETHLIDPLFLEFL